jgi:hypothetical protein
VGDWTLGGLDGSGWIGKLISGELGASARTGGDLVPDEDEISTGTGDSALGGLACRDTGTSASCSSIVSSANAKLKVNASVHPQEKDSKGHTSGLGIGRF